MDSNKFNFEIPSIVRESFRQTNKMHEDAIKSIEENRRKESEWKQKILEASEKTAQNTAVLPDILSLIKEGNDRQEEIFGIMVEILSISKSANEDEADNRYRKVLNKISTYSGDVETAQKLLGHAALVWNTVKSLF